MDFDRRRNPVRIVTVKRAGRVAEGLPAVLGPSEAADALRTLIGNKDREHFVALHLDARNHIIAAEVVAVGVLTSCLVHPREVFKGAIVNGAAAIICGHNHPSGDVTPSREDVEIEKRLRQSGELLGMNVLDFIIVSATTYWSTKEHGSG